MAIVTRKEFAEMCGDEVKTLNVYIGRRKAKLHDASGKTLDTEDLVNMLYKKNRIGLNNAKKEAATISQSIIPNPRRGKDFDSDEDSDENEGLSDSDKHFASKYVGQLSKGSGVNTEDPYIIKLLKDTELVEIKIQKEQILLDKAAGKLIPIDVAASLLQSQAKFIFSSFDTAVENIASIYCQIMANGDMKMYTKIVEEGKRALSNAIERAGMDADKDLETILTTFSQTNTNRML